MISTSFPYIDTFRQFWSECDTRANADVCVTVSSEVYFYRVCDFLDDIRYNCCSLLLKNICITETLK